MGLLSDYEQEQCATDKQALTSQTGSLKCCTFEALLKKKFRQASLLLEWKACVFSMCIGTDGLTPYAPSTYSILSCFARTLIEALLLSKRRYAKQLILFFTFRFLLCRANLTPCLAPGVYFLDPALLQPSPSYLHPCRPQ